MSKFPSGYFGSSKDDGFETSMGLLAKTADQDPDAWIRFVQLYYPLVMKWCRQSGLDSHEADNVTYEVLFKAVTKLKQFSKEKPDQMFRKWIRTITQRTLVSQSRQRIPAKGGHSCLINEVPFNEVMTDEELNRDTELLFCRAMDNVKRNTNPVHFQAFIEVVVNGRRPKDVASQLELTPNIVYQVKCRILNKLKSEFSNFFS